MLIIIIIETSCATVSVPVSLAIVYKCIMYGYSVANVHVRITLPPIEQTKNWQPDN